MAAFEGAFQNIVAYSGGPTQYLTRRVRVGITAPSPSSQRCESDDYTSCSEKIDGSITARYVTSLDFYSSLPEFGTPYPMPDANNVSVIARQHTYDPWTRVGPASISDNWRVRELPHDEYVDSWNAYLLDLVAQDPNDDRFTSSGPVDDAVDYRDDGDEVVPGIDDDVYSSVRVEAATTMKLADGNPLCCYTTDLFIFAGILGAADSSVDSHDFTITDLPPVYDPQSELWYEPLYAFGDATEDELGHTDFYVRFTSMSPQPAPS